MLIDPLRPRLQIGIMGVVEWPKVALGMATAALIALLGWRSLRDDWEPLPTAALFTGLAAMLPVLHIVPITVNVLTADRFLYLFAAGAAVALGSWARHLTTAQLRVAAACSLIAIGTFGVSTHLRSRDWGDPSTKGRPSLSSSRVGIGRGSSGAVTPGPARTRSCPPTSPSPGPSWDFTKRRSRRCER